MAGYRLRGSRIHFAALSLLFVGLTACGPAASPPSPAAGSRSRPILEYLQVLDGSGKPRTFFHPGDSFGARVEVYLRGGSAGNLAASWHVRLPSGATLSLAGSSFTPPARGDLFTATAQGAIPSGTRAGNGSVIVTVTAGTVRLTRSTGLQVGA